MPVGLLPGREISFPFLTPVVAIRESKEQSSWTLGYQVLRLPFPSRDGVLSRLPQQGIGGAASL